ncbi:hypothetical protein KIW84_043992 [Lathyrus oleraceus]|uniref:Ribosomal protein L34Ae n=1 Tax=Pisum sativum TaxID=3888 RepID=A0A9D4XJG5_PEA|nr:hypothetical protein KIW84_043992 [Pisum sativum]
MIWVLASIWIFLRNYVRHCIGSILTYIFRKKDLVALTSNEDYDIDEFTKGLADFLFPSYEEFLIAYEEQEQETETKYCVLVENNCDFRDDDEKGIEGIDCYNFIEDGNFMHNVFDGFHDMNLDENETFMHCLFDGFPEDAIEINDNERENPVFEEGDSNFHQDDRKSVEKVQEVEEEVEEEANGCNFIDTSYATTTTNEDEYLQEHRKFTSSSNFGESNNTNDCSLSSIIPCEDIESESLKEVEDSKETQFSCDREEVSRGFLDCKNEKESSLYHKEETYDGLSEKIEDDDDDDECDWDNNEIMKQIKLKLKYARQGGLSTIFEEEEEQEDDEEEKEYSLKDVEMIKTLSMKYKDQEKMKYEDRNVEIQKVYRCYAQKIRKLDLLNFQVMHAIDCIQLKDPLLMQKSTIRHIKPLVIPQTLGSLKAKKNIFDPLLKLVNDLHWDLELVYVGKNCLSWEILCWEHVKMKHCDAQLPHRYDLVASEFQLFQVLIQSLLEDNLFEKDSIKDDKRINWGEEDAIARENLDEIIKESMQKFLEFVKTYKDDKNVFHKVPRYRMNEIKDKEISELLEDIQTQLHKKERKVKEKLRSGNWIIRKFQKQNESQIQLDHEQLLAQVGLRLISKVISMEKLRKDHLIWCSEKLNQIKFGDKKVQVEPSVFLFPC